ncbi:MAG: RagB/SusD family nutrient uptake outer membrane protein [Prevotella sp.]|nr:RagB/SusD family nutrient uptake outer membrane protein [Prevotella sp.]
MTSFKTKYFQKAGRVCCGIAAALVSAFALTSCDDFFEQDSDHVLFADKDHLNNSVDTMYSVVGIMSKMQAIADRTILLGEVRADLVEVTDVASADLRQMALFEIDDDNIYNQPRDYYAIINNCNYFIANADTALKNNRDQYIFRREYAVVKAYRAWAYLQLAQIYGQVRYLTEPILTKQDADKEDNYPMLGIRDLCLRLIDDLEPLVPTYATEYPAYGEIAHVDTRLLYFPLYIMLGELQLWAAQSKEDYWKAAVYYYKYISTRNGLNSAYTTGTEQLLWTADNSLPSSWTKPATGIGNGYLWVGESYSNRSELITMIAGDSARVDGNYSELRNIFNSTQYNDYHPSLVPSKALQDISEAQIYCFVTEDEDTLYAQRDLNDHLTGDLRLADMWYTQDNVLNTSTNERLTYQYIEKYTSRNVHIWRRQMVYLRMAEALNRAGYPRFAFEILQEGVSDRNIARDVLPYYSKSDSARIASTFSFPTSLYVLAKDPNYTQNTQGIHSRGSGNSAANQYYQFPEFTTADSLELQIDSIEKLIVTEGALEFAFEGYRYYDLMRVALRRNDPSFLADRIYARRGIDHVGEIKSEIKKDLYNTSSWYLSWKGKIGLGK